MLVVEGPDGAGKSTLVKHLSDKFGIAIGLRGVADRDKLYTVTRRDTYNALAAAVRGVEVRIWDRLFVSEFVYADIVDRPCEFSSNETVFVQDVMEAISFPMIICLPPWEVVEANATKAHQMKGVNENLQRIYYRYKNGHLPWPENHVWYDYTEQTGHFATLKQVEEEVAGYLEMRMERQAW